MVAGIEDQTEGRRGGEKSRDVERRAIDVRGIVQGVGFRPFVYSLAARHGLAGFVRNHAGRVVIEVEGTTAALDRFLADLETRAPPLAAIDHLAWEPRPPVGDRDFRIEASEAGDPSSVFISPDVATCPDCLAELFDPADRRHRYPFTNCTNCGPRLTIITGAPYDRARTTMAGFAMCPACRAEYDDPADRRFHAQPVACPACGPHVRLLDARGEPITSDDPTADFAGKLVAGRIGALKGLGGYHLGCDARSDAAVAELRRRKHRDEKPFAVMLPDVAAAEAVCEVSPAEADLLRSPRAPIVLLRKRPASGIADGVAPGNPWLGVILPYTPLHHLLVRAVGGIPLVMTSGNRSDEPIVYQDDAVDRLADIADLFLTHDRPIHVRCDDSVTRIIDGIELPVRRSRGYAPRPVALPVDCPVPILAVGGQLKATFALGRGRQAFLSHHLGDLDHYDAYRAFERDQMLFQELVGIRPTVVACDLHPDYATTRFAAQTGAQLVPVQHHHAHLASCLAENGVADPVIGVMFDGTGYGTDGCVWGGEFLVGGLHNFRRAGHLRYVPMPGGDQAIREPWRMAAAHLWDAGEGFGPLETRGLHPGLATIRTMLVRQINAPLTSSAGRLFDAVAALAGIRDRVSYEGQAAIELEGLATGIAADGSYPFQFESGPVCVVDTRPLVRAVARDAASGVGPAKIGRRFHSSLVEVVATVCDQLRRETGLGAVALSGGVFLNALFTHEVFARLTRDGFRVYRHRLVPPNDGGLSLGQLAVAAAQLSHSAHDGGPPCASASPAG
jgi:hydrogenase maturation protein HypF